MCDHILPAYMQHMQQKAYQCGKKRNHQGIATNVWRRDFAWRAVCQFRKRRTLSATFCCYNAVCDILLYFFRDYSRLENPYTAYPVCFSVSAAYRLGALLHNKICTFTLSGACYVAGTNIQEYTPVDCLTENKSVTGFTFLS